MVAIRILCIGGNTALDCLSRAGNRLLAGHSGSSALELVMAAQ